jgi:hypothetical protein
VDSVHGQSTGLVGGFGEDFSVEFTHVKLGRSCWVTRRRYEGIGLKQASCRGEAEIRT